ncbi:MAG: phage recombination protein Bet [Gemmatimonadales bacterium]|nr:phage recombination protein Bet [Gemmatimonadales bacterium]
MTTQLATIGPREVGPQFSPEQVELIKTQIAPGASDGELKLFMAVCAKLDLDPFRKQIYAIKRSTNTAKKGQPPKWEDRMAIQVGIDGLLAIAERSREFAGVTLPQFCGEDGVWRDILPPGVKVFAVKIGVMRRGWREPVFALALMSEYFQDNAMWRDRPAGQLEKCALAKALRRAFPNEFAAVRESTDIDVGDYVDTDTDEIVEGHAGAREPEPAPPRPPDEPTKAKRVAPPVSREQAAQHGPRGSQRVEGTVYKVGGSIDAPTVGIDKQGARKEFTVSLRVPTHLVPTADHVGLGIVAYVVGVEGGLYDIVQVARLDPPQPTPEAQMSMEAGTRG